MIRYILYRSGYSLLLVWGIVTFTFLLLNAVPGDPSTIYLRPDIDAETLYYLRKHMGLDLPIWQRYWNWLFAASKGILGISFTHHRPVLDLLAEALPNTLRLTIVVFFLQLFGGIGLAIVMALIRRPVILKGIESTLAICYSLPGFVIALFLIYVFSYQLNWLPSGQMQSMLPTEGRGYLGDLFRHTLLPALAFAIPLGAFTARLTYGNLCEVLSKPYIRTAQAYGISRTRILFSDALRNALLPLITMSGLFFPVLLGGSVIIENVFAWPGMGTIAVQAVHAYDYPVIIAVSIISAISIVIGNLLADILYVVCDPRINLHNQVQV
ncbi:MAG: ABC transporter permease [Calditrichia bacterium]